MPILYAYDSRGNLKEIDHQDGFRVSYQYEYDSHGNMTSKTEIYGNGSSTRTEYVYEKIKGW